jgi:FlaA1/EpsC-like NDP-sugar epimerase
MKIEIITKGFIKLPRLYKQIIIAATDSILLEIGLWLSFSLRLGVFYVPESREIVWVFLALPLLAIPIFVYFGLYRAIIRYIGFRALWSVLQAVTLYAMLLGLMYLFLRAETVPRSVVIINWLVAVLFIGGTRMIARWWLTGAFSEMGALTANHQSKVKVAIYGAGTTGVQLANALAYSKEYKPIAFLDDKSELHNTLVNALRVYPFSKIAELIPKLEIQEVLLAIPHASRRRQNQIIELLEKYPVHVRTLPSMSALAGGQVKIEDIKEVDIEDLLGRDPVKPFQDLLHADIESKVVMVTGAGGSIGSELCRQILRQRPAKIVLYEANEYALYSIESDLKSAIDLQDSDRLVAILGSTLDKQHLEQVCKIYQVNTIYHAAAYKHVPLVEKNPLEAVQNNIIGTLIAARAAIAMDVETFVLISSDKAVRPTNVMGASKRFAELILQALAETEPRTRFCMVRFGNVLGSSGSVVPRFREQIKKGGPVTVTHPDIIRYFMTIPEAAQLVIQAGAMSHAGDVFLLDMGDPVRIDDLARTMIHLSGLTVEEENNPGGDIRIEYTGLRPGEKLYEELLIAGNPIATKHPRIYRARERYFPWQQVKGYIDSLEKGLQAGDVELVLTVLLNAVTDYHPQGTIEDAVWKEKRRRKDINTVVQLKDFRSPHTGDEPDASSQ